MLRSSIRSTLARSAVPMRQFHGSSALAIQVGDSIPSTPLYHGSPGDSVDLSKETAHGKYLLIGVPGAFSPGCSGSHIPGYLSLAKTFQKEDIKKAFVVSVNDAFVTGAWEQSLYDAAGGANPWIEVLADPKGEFSDQLDALFDAANFFGNQRSKRYAAIIENGKVAKVFEEPDKTSVDVSAADQVAENL